MDVAATVDPTVSVPPPIPPPPFAINERVYCPGELTNRTDGTKQSSCAVSSTAVTTTTPNSCYYEATIRKIQLKNHTDWYYLVHYTGWNSRFDRWFDAALIRRELPVLPDSDGQENYHCSPNNNNNNNSNGNTTTITSNTSPMSQKNDTSNTNTKNNNKKKRTHATTTTTATTTRRKRWTDARPTQHDTDTDCSSSNTQQDQLPVFMYQDYCALPFTLQTVLVDENEQICMFHKLHTLPARIPVAKVLIHYRKKKVKEYKLQNSKNTNDTTTRAAVTESNESNHHGTTIPLTVAHIQNFIDGMTELFCEAVPTMLLYPCERAQYETYCIANNVPQDNRQPLTEVYGCEFLLRLFVRLPVLLQQSTFAKSLSNALVLGPLLEDLIVLLQINRQTLFENTSSYRLVQSTTTTTTTTMDTQSTTTTTTTTTTMDTH